MMYIALAFSCVHDALIADYALLQCSVEGKDQ